MLCKIGCVSRSEWNRLLIKSTSCCFRQQVKDGISKHSTKSQYDKDLTWLDGVCHKGQVKNLCCRRLAAPCEHQPHPPKWHCRTCSKIDRAGEIGTQKYTRIQFGGTFPGVKGQAKQPEASVCSPNGFPHVSYERGLGIQTEAKVSNFPQRAWVDLRCR